MAAGADGRTYLTWVESHEGRSRLLVAASSADPSLDWEPARPVSEGEAWFENWADFPGSAALADGMLLVYWFERFPNPEYPTGYYAWTRLSADGGQTWGRAQRLHEDRSPVEHGFVSAYAADPARFGLVWLDGREGREAALAGEGGHESGHGAGTATRLYFRSLDRSGTFGAEVLLDERVCDCCQTDMAQVDGSGALVAYRDRGPSEERDMALVGRARSGWNAPEPLVVDGPFPRDDWTIAGCPVNGPSISARGRRVALIHYTEGQGTARPGRPIVQASLSLRGGQAFEPLATVDDGLPLGRVGSAMLPDGTLIVSWLERVDGGAQWRLRAYSPTGTPGPSLAVATTSPMRKSGFACLAPHGNGARIVWSDLLTGRVRTAEIALAPTQR